VSFSPTFFYKKQILAIFTHEVGEFLTQTIQVIKFIDIRAVLFEQGG
jgi:hypothetical protein